ncbi:ribbon-helix-helix domain-containing protein [Sphingomicrobium arenosum]|uniref:ribbon-helix-helix domain-containing protein n=1 Tax=Sphingomicrobium arenosum TaxID=2233861 RepID=UPI002240F05A|nr:ribbon-helix-helix domain-containing protein [Sphingomicrobium arenosum]
MSFTPDPVAKRSVTIGGHETSISLEPLFWEALKVAAAERNLPVNALVARIDLTRFDETGAPRTGLASAIRQWLMIEGPIARAR